MADPRQHEGPLNPQELEIFNLNPVLAHYVKFSCTSYYGNGCVLQYIEAIEGMLYYTYLLHYYILARLQTGIFHIFGKKHL